jgi:hypothetical protein
MKIDFEKLPTYRLGMKQGAYATALKIADKLLRLGLNEAQVIELTEVPLAEIEAYRIGVEQSTHAQALAIAARLLAQGMEPDQIATATDLNLVDIEALKTPPTA